MSKKEPTKWFSTFSMTALLDEYIGTHFNLWLLADEILEAGEISDELFKRIGKALAGKILKGFMEKELIYGGGVAKNF